MTELKNTYYKQLQPGEMHLFSECAFYKYERVWIDEDINSLSLKNNEFITNMISITAYNKELIASKIQEIINILPGEYCLIFSHFVNLKPDYVNPFYILDLAFVSLNNIPEKYKKT